MHAGFLSENACSCGFALRSAGHAVGSGGRVVVWRRPPCASPGKFGHNNFESSLCRALCPSFPIPFHEGVPAGIFGQDLNLFLPWGFRSFCPRVFPRLRSPRVCVPALPPEPAWLGVLSVLIFWRGSQVTRWVWEGRARVLRFLGAGRPFGPASLGGLRVRVPLRAEERPPAWGSPGLWPSGVWVVGSAGLVCPVLVWHTPFTSA